ncbi:sodium:calcium antiporter [Halocola ammonii]
MELSLETSIYLFIIFSVVIGVGGTYLTKVADILADKTGWGEALVGAVLLGAATSISGVVTSVTAAFEGFPELSMSNALGGIAAQTFFLVLADVAYKKANLEHAAASFTNLMFSALLLCLLSLLLLVMTGPNVTFLSFHPGSVILFAMYLFGIRMISSSRQEPMWRPRNTKETRPDIPDEKHLKNRLWVLVLKFVTLGVVVGGSGYLLTESAITITTETGIDETLVGALMTAVVTSLPEMITTVAAVKRGALTLAVGGVIGGNCFDMLFAVFSDFAYTEGSIYHAISSDQLFILTMTLAMTSVLMLGLLFRQKAGLAKLGWETVLITVIFFGGYTILFLG